MISLAYRRRVAALGCCIEACKRAFYRADACHTGRHGKKSSDLTCIPLCRNHRKKYDANPQAFCEKFALNVPEMVAALNALLLPQICLHRPARRRESPEFIKTACICGWSSGWFRSLAAAQDSLHSHLTDQEKAAA